MAVVSYSRTAEEIKYIRGSETVSPIFTGLFTICGKVLVGVSSSDQPPTPVDGILVVYGPVGAEQVI